MFGSEALPDINYLVCCLMKIHVHLKRDECCGKWGAWRREGQQFWGQRQTESDSVVEHLFVSQVAAPLNAIL